MSKKTRRRKGKAPLKDDVTQITKEKEQEAIIITDDEPKLSGNNIIFTGDPLQGKKTQLETVLLTAPRLPWKIDTTYIDKDFRKAYVAMLKNLVELYDLPYYVNQEAILTRKE